jgi:hypothetical protein
MQHKGSLAKTETAISVCRLSGSGFHFDPSLLFQARFAHIARNKD